MSPWVKDHGKSKVQRPCRGTGGERGGGGYATERHIGIKFFLNPKFMFKPVPSRGIGSYAPESYIWC